jgi:large subunit ribosomal protein L16
MLFPKKVKHRKWMTGRKNEVKLSRPETRGTDLSFGQYGLKAMTQARITSNQLEAARKAVTRAAGKTGKVWIRIFPDRPITQKGAETPMGKGKGDLDHYAVDIRPGKIIFEVDGVTEAVGREALRKGGTKLPITCKVISRKLM